MDEQGPLEFQSPDGYSVDFYVNAVTKIADELKFTAVSIP
jgi:hypothetical protein